MKAALCFLISYDHKLNKEHIWREWIEPNKDILEVYVHYKEKEKIKSDWLREKAIPIEWTVETDYTHVVPAYFSLLQYGLQQRNIQWFCFVTDACVPIVSPSQFREMFFLYSSYSLMSWRKPWWNIWLCKRANLHLFDSVFHLGHAPWFVISRSDALLCLEFKRKYRNTYKTICAGVIANESIFAIILKAMGALDRVKNVETTATDWSRMMSPTSPFLFTTGDAKDRVFIDDFIKKNTHTMFLRKVDTSFPDSILREYIREKPVSYIKQCQRFFIEKKALFLNKMDWIDIFLITLLGVVGSWLILKNNRY